MDTAQWAQGIGVVKKPLMDEGSSSSLMSTRPAAAPPPPSASAQSQSQLVERRARPVKEQALRCPRCNSTNTKFCYYNNYSLTQPRYFCKTCRRYWTEGGSLRNVPVGGGSRKNKRHSSSASSSSTSSSSTKINNMQPPLPAAMPSSSLPIPQISASKPYQGQDLNLAFPHSTSFPDLIGGGGFPASMSGGQLSAMELLRSTGITARGLGPLVHLSMAPETGAAYSGAGFGMHDFSSPAAGFIGSGNNGNVMQEGGGRLLFPFGKLKQVNVKSGNENGDEQNTREQGGDPPVFWSGANLGGGSW